MTGRFTGSGRAKEGGFLAVHKQDFNAHITGGDFRHTADQMDMSPPISGYNHIFEDAAVQGTLEKIAAILSTAGEGFITIGDGYSVGDYTVGVDYPSIETAFAQALTNSRLQKGGVILIKAGTYIVTTTITVPPGVTVLGESRGTILIGHMSGAPMFLIQRGLESPPIGNAQNLLVGGPMDGIKFLDIVLADNLDGYAPFPRAPGAPPYPTMVGVPMIECEIGSRLECTGVSFVGQLETGGTGITRCAIDYTSGAATGTTLVCERCYFDGLGYAAQFPSGNGDIDNLTISNCRARTFGVPAIGPLGNCFVGFAPCNATLTNNYHISEESTAYCFVYFASYSATDPNPPTRIVISGNSGGASNGLSGTFFHNLAGGLYQGSVSNNTWGVGAGNGWSVAVSSSNQSPADIIGQYALQYMLSFAGSFTGTSAQRIYVLGNNNTITKQAAVSSGTLPALIGVKQGTAYPKVILDLSLSANLDTILNKTLYLGNYISGIEFTSSGAFHTITSRFTSDIHNVFGNIIIDDCYFYDAGFVVATTGGASNTYIDSDSNSNVYATITLQNTQFRQSGTLPENCSFILPEANEVILRNVIVSGVGYVGGIGHFGSVGYGTYPPAIGPTFATTTSNVLLDSCLFDIQAGQPGFTGPRTLISNYAPYNPVPHVQEDVYFYIGGGDACNVTILNTKIMADSTFATAGSAIFSSGLLTGGTANAFCKITGGNITIKDCLFNGPAQNFASGGTNYPVPALKVNPAASFSIENSRVLYGALPMQVYGQFDNSTIHAGIFIKDSEFASCPNIGHSVLDIDVSYGDTVSDPLATSILPKVAISDCIFKQNDPAADVNATAPKHFINTDPSVYYTASLVQIYAGNFDVIFKNNHVTGTTYQVGAYSSPFTSVAGLFINNYDCSDVTYTAKYPATVDVGGNIIVVSNNFENAATTSFAVCSYIKAACDNINNNTFIMSNVADAIHPADPPASNYCSWLGLDNAVPAEKFGSSTVVTGNYFARGKRHLTYPTPLKRAGIFNSSTSGSNGIIVDNVFEDITLRTVSTYDPTHNYTLFEDKLSAGYQWLFERNKNQTVTRAITFTSGRAAVTESGTPYMSLGYDATDIKWYDTPLATSHLNINSGHAANWIINLLDVLPQNVYVTDGYMVVSSDGAWGSPVTFADAELTFIANSGIIQTISTSFVSYVPNTNVPLDISSFTQIRNDVINNLYLQFTVNISVPPGTTHTISVSSILVTYRW